MTFMPSSRSDWGEIGLDRRMSQRARGTQTVEQCAHVSARGTDVALLGVSQRYGRETAALSGINLDVKQGELLTLLGPSGSGKSTALSIISGLLRPSEGRVLFGGNDVTDLPAYRRNLGFVFQDYALFPHMSVFENIAFPLRARRAKSDDIKSRVGQMLEMVQLSSLGSRQPAQLSGGQRQRVALGRALVFDPPILLMDEPLGALDNRLRKDMQLEIRALQRKLGITAIHVTHDQEEALLMSDRVAVMNKGRIEQVATPQQLYERPETRFVGEFVGEINCVEALVEASDELSWTARTRQGLRFTGSHRSPIRPGTAVVIGLRPERVRLEASGSAGAVAEAQVEEAAYVGDWRKIRIRIGKQLLWSKVPNTDRVEITPGSCVSVSWGREDPIVLEVS
jgi:putative spermidine/putrescine transport system ATP-binding protein